MRLAVSRRRAYTNISDAILVAESHEKGKAWDCVYNRDEKEASGYGDVITDEIIKATYGC